MLDGSTLINKFHSSKSKYIWNLKTKDGLVYIENKEENKVLELQIGAYDLEDQFNEDYHYSGDEIIGDDEIYYDSEDKLIEDDEGYYYSGDKINGDDEDHYYSGDFYFEDNKPLKSAFIEDNPKQLWKKTKPDTPRSCTNLHKSPSLPKRSI